MPSIFKPQKPFSQTNAWQHQNLNSLQYNTSIAGSVIALIYGKTRQSVNLIGFGDYRGPSGKKGKNGPLPITGTHQNAKGGKGGGGSKKGAGGKKSQDFSIDVSFGVCQGPADIAAHNFVWVSAGVAFFQSVGLNLYTGADGQAPDPVMSGLGQVVGYSGTLYVTGTPMDLGSSPVIPNISFEVTGFLSGTGGTQFTVDADPSQVVVDFLTNDRYGADFPLANIASDIQTIYGDYCVAAQLPISVALQVQTQAHEWLSGLAKLTNSAIVWSGNLLKIIPYGDLPLAAGSVSWTPNMVPEYSLTDDDFLPWSPHLDINAPQEGQEDPVLITRTNPADAVNWLTIEYIDRDNFYNPTIIAVFDQSTIDQYGLRSGENLQGHLFANAISAQISAQLWLQRLLYVRNLYKWQCGWSKSLLEPMDIVLLTDTRSGLNAQPVRITSIEENENGDLTFEGEEISIGTSAPPPTPPAIAVVDSITWAVDNSDTITSDGSQPIPGSPAVGITTMINNTLIIAAMSSDRGTTPIAPVSSVSSTSGLTWSKLDGVTSVMPGFPNHLNVEVWVAVAPTPVTNEYITFHLPAVVPANRGLAIAVEGVSTGSFTLDGAVLDNTVSAAGSGKPTVTMTTTNAHDILIYVSAINGNDDLAGIPIPAGFTYGAGLKNFYMLFGGGLRLGYEIVTSTQTGLVLTSAVGTNIPGICIAFALEGI